MTEAELMWMVGLLEGEGCFDTHAPNRQKNPAARIQCKMTDFDVIERLASIGGGKVYGPYQANPRWKPQLHWVIRGQEAAELMRVLQPHMGKRRAARIEEVLHQTRQSERANNLCSLSS